MQPDWRELFVPSVSLLELVLRGTLMYLGLFFAMRFFRRPVGGVGIADLLLVVLIADAAQNAMSADYHSITEGAVLVGTIFGWNFPIDWLDYRFPRLRPLLEPAPLPLIENGRIIRRNLKAEMITVEELRGQLREHGVEDMHEVRRAWLESDGHVSVIKRSGESTDKPNKGTPQRP